LAAADSAAAGEDLGRSRTPSHKLLKKMKNYSHKTNKTVTRYRTPATFRLRAVFSTQKSKANKKNFSGSRPGKYPSP
jgi:hypothetical protein